MRFESGLWRRLFRQPIPKREKSRAEFAASIGAEFFGPGAAWPEPIPDDKEQAWRQQTCPALPGRTLYDGSVHPARPAHTIKVPVLVDKGSRLPPPTGRKWPRGWTGWKLALFMGLTFFGLSLGMPFGGDFYGGESSTALVDLPFIDTTDPVWNLTSTTANGTTDNATALQTLMNTGAGTYYFGYNKIYSSTVPILYDPGTWIVGMGNNRRQTKSGTTFRVLGGGVAANWAGQAFFTSRGYANNTAITNLGELCGFRDCLFDGNSQTYGSAILCAGISAPMFFDLRIEAFSGTQAMGTRGAGNSKAAGQGVGIILTVFTLNGGDANTGTNPNPVDAGFRFVRGNSNANNTLIWTDDGVNNASQNAFITDSICYYVYQGAQPSAADNGQAVYDINHAGGWIFHFARLNGPGGDGLFLRNCLNTQVSNCWLDGWGTAAAGGATYYQIRCTSVSGGGASNTGVTASNNVVRIRAEQTGGTTTYVWMLTAASGKNTSMVSNGNNGWIESNAATGKFFLYDFSLGGGQIRAAINGNNWEDENGAAFTDASTTRGIFTTAVPNSSIIITGTGNNWQFRAAVPTVGNFPVGYQMWNTAPAAGSFVFAVCTGGTAGNSTWNARYIPAGAGTYFPGLGTGVTATAVVALTVYLTPIWIPELIPTVTGNGINIGSNAGGGNYAVGLYDSTGALIVQSTSTVFPAGPTLAKAFSAAQTNVVPGRYFLALACELAGGNTVVGTGKAAPNTFYTATNAATAPASVVTLPPTTGALVSSAIGFNMQLF